MFSAHPTTDPGIIFSPKPTKKHTSELTLKIDNLKPRKNKQTATNRLPTGSPNPVKIKKNPTLESKLSPLVLLSNPQPPIGEQRFKKQVPMSQKRSSKYQKWSISAISLFNKSSVSIVNLFNKHPYQQSTYQQSQKGPAAGAKPQDPPRFLKESNTPACRERLGLRVNVSLPPRIFTMKNFL